VTVTSGDKKTRVIFFIVYLWQVLLLCDCNYYDTIVKTCM